MSSGHAKGSLYYFDPNINKSLFWDMGNVGMNDSVICLDTHGNMHLLDASQFRDILICHNAKLEKDSILDDVERRYLSAVIRPFRDKVVSIAKFETISKEYSYIAFQMKDNADSFGLPFFESDSMYNGMIPDKEYTLEELGL